ncbi:BgTH12-05573 [Blumeria graminis f. sp. triticale]|uniref:BgTH12-05573 n=1 Tax=Blumeria graminis f. sp. triticale TaxID=1689686 RepID=A0A9W4GGG1_BLUGR|nr:BgTH12-05573 [Blumeria graminis f. sp. triticale]
MKMENIPAAKKLAQVNNLKPIVNNVRQDTAELAVYALSDRRSMRNLSPASRQRKIYLGPEENPSLGPNFNDLMSKSQESSYLKVTDGMTESMISRARTLNTENHGKSSIRNGLRCYLSRNLQCDEMNKPGTRPMAYTSLDNDFDQSSSFNLPSAPPNLSEQTPLLQQDIRKRDQNDPVPINGQQDVEGQYPTHQRHWSKISHLIESSKIEKFQRFRLIGRPKSWDFESSWLKSIQKPAQVLPAVTLGLLLNILDALSYGMILFPRGLAPFSKLGPAGISMFYVSCIVSQLVFSCGGSGFKGGVGSEMIEVVPFFHSMAQLILDDMGDSNPSAVVATTLVAYASSSILTGVVFFLIGHFSLGHIVGFIPRHILIGSIGGVGWFLLNTGLEVTAHLETMEYKIATLQKLLDPETFLLWLIPLSLAIFQIFTDKKLNFKYYLPAFVMLIPVIFHTVVASFSKLDIPNLRSTGWIFNGSHGEPWWHFYTLYNFSLVNWGSVLKCVPAMFALTFFGILHVPINVPSLAFVIREDNFDIDRELLAHGASNMISGLLGSVQNYLVYTNSVIFIKTGGGSRLAGILLALTTGMFMMTGSSIIGYIPVMMVGVLIFILGIDLLREALWEPRKKLKIPEYITVLVIVIVMGVYDFVAGIFVGIGLAFLSLVFQTSRLSAIRAIYSGEVAGSTVRRNPAQSWYLKNVGKQIQVFRLTGYLFFGTIASFEKKVCSMIESAISSEQPFRFVIFDFFLVTGIDYSSAEVFGRLNRNMSKKGICLILSGFSGREELQSTLESVGINQSSGVKMFKDLNSALEDCENELLKTFYASQESRNQQTMLVRSLDVPKLPISHLHALVGSYGSPRRSQLRRAAAITLDECPGVAKHLHLKEPLRLILQIFSILTDKNEDFWLRAAPYFSQIHFLSGTVIFRRGDPAEGFYLLQKGIMRADYDLPQGHFSESIVAGTTCGELPFFSGTVRTATVVADCDCIAWVMDCESWAEMQRTEPDVAQEVLRVGLKLTSERMNTITNYFLTTAS